MLRDAMASETEINENDAETNTIELQAISVKEPASAPCSTHCTETVTAVDSSDAGLISVLQCHCFPA